MQTTRSNSIRKRFTRGLAIVITVIMLIFSVVLIVTNSRSIEQDLNDQLAKLSVFSKNSLGSALWQYNHDYVEEHIESLFLYEDMVFARVVNNEKVISQKAHPDYAKWSFEDFLSSSDFLYSDTQVNFKNVTVGNVQLVLTKERIGDLVVTSSALAIFFLLVVNLSIFCTNLVMSRRYLFEPLSKLEASVRKIAGGNLNAPIETGSNDEIGQLSRSFSQMMESLKTITTSRDDLNQEVEERKKIELELKSSLKEKEILLREVHHRVKNNMQIVQSLLRLQSGKIDNQELKQAIQDSINRIRSMALIHETLYRSDDFSDLDLDAYFKSIVEGLYKIYYTPDKNITWQVTLDSVRLDIDKSIACGLIVNELVTNSLKYAFADARDGQISVQLKQLDDQTAVLSVTDDGTGMQKSFHWKSVDSLGFQIVGMLSEDQLDGHLDVSSNNGLAVVIHFPLKLNKKMAS